MSLFFMIIALGVSAFVLSQTLLKRLPEKESVLWMLGCIAMIVLSLFPKSMDGLAAFIGIDYPPSLYFFIAIMFLGILIFRLITQMEDSKRKSDALARKVALLENEIEEMKRANKSNK